MNKTAAVFGALALAVLALGLTGGIWPPGLSFAVARVPAAVVAFLCALMIRTRWISFGMMVLALAGLFGPARSFLGPTIPDGPVSVYQKNVLYKNSQAEDLAQDILARNADIVTLQEIDPVGHPLATAMQGAYATRHWCRFKVHGGGGVLSRWPQVPGTARCLSNLRTALVQVQAPGGPLWVVSLHLYWPYPSRQAWQVDQLLPVLRELDGPIILAGDFNMLPWGGSVQALADATGTQRIGGARPSYWIMGAIPVSIDHVLSAGGGTIDVLPRFESDHFGIFARVHPGKGYGEDPAAPVNRSPSADHQMETASGFQIRSQ